MARRRKGPQKTLVPKKRLSAFLRGPFKSESEQETLALARRLGRALRAGTVVALTGEIGSGKTLFIKGLARGLGVKDSDEVKSPTFVLLHLYEGRVPIQHFDLYRLEKENELEGLGFDDLVSTPDAVSVVEWADRAARRIPKDAFWVHLEVTGPTSRRIRFRHCESRSPPKKLAGRRRSSYLAVIARRRSKRGRSNLRAGRLLRAASRRSQ